VALHGTRRQAHKAGRNAGKSARAKHSEKKGGGCQAAFSRPASVDKVIQSRVVVGVAIPSSTLPQNQQGVCYFNNSGRWQALREACGMRQWQRGRAPPRQIERCQGTEAAEALGGADTEARRGAASGGGAALTFRGAGHRAPNTAVSNMLMRVQNRRMAILATWTPCIAAVVVWTPLKCGS
jgi:hypothetical protein